MLYAYLDESYTGDLKMTPEYVVAGFIGTGRGPISKTCGDSQ